MSITEWVANVYLERGITRVFLYPGGTIAPLVNARVVSTEIKKVMKKSTQSSSGRQFGQVGLD